MVQNQGHRSKPGEFVAGNRDRLQSMLRPEPPARLFWKGWSPNLKRGAGVPPLRSCARWACHTKMENLGGCWIQRTEKEVGPAFSRAEVGGTVVEDRRRYCPNRCRYSIEVRKALTISAC